MLMHGRNQHSIVTIFRLRALNKTFRNKFKGAGELADHQELKNWEPREKKTTQKQRAIRLFKTTNEERILKAVREQNIYFI